MERPERKMASKLFSRVLISTAAVSLIGKFSSGLFQLGVLNAERGKGGLFPLCRINIFETFKRGKLYRRFRKSLEVSEVAGLNRRRGKPSGKILIIPHHVGKANLRLIDVGSVMTFLPASSDGSFIIIALETLSKMTFRCTESCAQFSEFRPRVNRVFFLRGSRIKHERTLVQIKSASYLNETLWQVFRPRQ